MSIIKGKTNIVAGFGGTKRPLGEVYFSQSGLASDNPGALPGWTGEYYENAKTLFPDLYNFVKAHSELQVTKAQYDNAIATYGECPKYVADENGITTETDVTMSIKEATTSGTYLFRNDPPTVGDDYWFVSLSPSEIPDPITLQAPTGKITAVTTNELGVISSVTFGTDTTTDWEGIGEAVADITTISGTGTSLRLPKLSNYIKMANSTEGIMQKGAGLPDVKAYSATAATNASSWIKLPSYAKAVVNTEGNSMLYGSSIGATTTYAYVESQASLGNAIYGSSDTVQPANTTLYPWISAFTSAVPASTAQAAEFTGALSGKANTDLSNVLANIDYVVESKVPTESDPSWYRKYKSGWLEQGGLVASTSGATGTVQTLLKPFANANYTLTATARGTFDRSFLITSKAATTFSCAYSSSAVGAYDWRAEGLGAN